jgi:Co/Zn/Cd efflux system component
VKGILISFSSTVKASSSILLQGTPSNISLETVHKLLETICGVISVHGTSSSLLVLN